MNSKQVAPDWSKAPKWAKFWAMHADGSTFWSECEPIPFISDGLAGYLAGYRWVNRGRTELAFNPGDVWVSSLQERPAAKEESLAETVLPDEKYERG